MPTNTPKELRTEINLYIQQVQVFYHRNCHSDINKKLESITDARNLISEINGCYPVEIPFRIMALRRLLTGLLPYTGYPEHEQLSNKLNEILTDCHLHIAQNLKQPALASPPKIFTWN
jgi:hypothetical protein